MPGAQLLASNSAFLFFSSGDSLYAMNKHGYTNFYFDMQLDLSQPTSLVTYLDSLLIIAEELRISVVDVSHLGLDITNQQEPFTPLNKNYLYGQIPGSEIPAALLLISATQDVVNSAVIRSSSAVGLAVSAALASVFLLIL